ncbi:hypothetical protein BN1708_008391 [Verticillium longisporum]|uniref:Uncharacterized protein n=1 Tax=Verticillium longisporum TaxID=100787 RepID=A0A0G4N3P9_VERLO|nr:hypothetical protein BN1708_008391 [Verticillium longisporum]
MAPSRSHSSSRPPISSSRRKQRGPALSMNLFRIPKDQKELLERPDAWAESSASSNLGLVNIPPHALESLRYFESSRVLPPGAQKPLSSGASAPKSTAEANKVGGGSTKEPDIDEEDGSEAESNASGVSWSPSPPPPQVHKAQQSIDLSNGQSQAESSARSVPLPPSSPSYRRRRSPKQNTLERPAVASSASNENPHAVFQTQAPLFDMESTSSPVKSNNTMLESQEKAQVQSSPILTRAQQKLPPASFPPSSLDHEDDMEMEIPGELLHATPPINKISARINASQGIVLDTPPPCGQGSAGRLTSASTGTQARSANPPRQRWKILQFSDGPDVPASATISDTPATVARTQMPKRTEHDHGQTSSAGIITSTFPNTEVLQVHHLPSTAEQGSSGIPTPKVPTTGLSSTANQEAFEGAQMETRQPHQALSASIAGKLVNDFSAQPTTDPFTDGPDFRERFLLEPLETFQSAYRSFDGSLGDFVRACVSLKSLRRERRLPVFLYDDFVRVFCDDYIQYVSETDESRPMYAMEWYVDNVSKPIYQKGVLTKDNIDRVLKMYPDEYNAIREALGLSRSHTPTTNAGDRSFFMAVDPPEPQSLGQQPIDTSAKTSNDVSPSPFPRRLISDRSADSGTEAYVSASENPLSGAEKTPARASRDCRSPSADVVIISSVKKAEATKSTPRQRDRRRSPHTKATPGRSSPGLIAAATPSQQARHVNDGGPSTSRSKGKASLRYSLDGRSQTNPPVSQRATLSRQSLPPQRHHTTTVSGLDRAVEPLPTHETPERPQTAVAKSRALPRSFSSHGTMARPQTPHANKPADSAARSREMQVASGSRPSSSRPSASRLPTLTQESGVSKQKKQSVRAEQYRLKLEKLKAAGRLPGMAGSWASHS